MSIGQDRASPTAPDGLAAWKGMQKSHGPEHKLALLSHLSPGSRSLLAR